MEGVNKIVMSRWLFAFYNLVMGAAIFVGYLTWKGIFAFG